MTSENHRSGAITAVERDHDLVAARIAETCATMERLRDPVHVAAVVTAAEIIADSLRAGGKLLLFGNGGSAADAQHIAGEFLGRFLLERAALPAISLSDNTASVTAIGNDYAFEDVFARQVAGLGAPGDVALAISTSGNSGNVLAGVAEARARGLRTIGLTGDPGGALVGAVDHSIAVPADATPRIQEAQIVVAHLICELVERDLAADA
jgi:D-sedoheptulose 7-phosphate isomerase